MKRRGLMNLAGDPCFEQPVDASLRWLHFHKDEDGSFDADGFMEHCKEKTKCKVGFKGEFDVGSTGLCALAFLNRCHTHRVGEFKKTVRKALQYLISKQQNDGLFINQDSDFSILEHILATAATCEAYAMTNDKALENASISALDYLVKNQNPDGGWSVKHGEPSTATATAWAELATKCARVASLSIPMRAIKGPARWFEKAMDEHGNVAAVLPDSEGNATILSSPRGRLGMAAISIIFGDGINAVPDKLKHKLDELAKTKIDPSPEDASHYLDLYFLTYAYYHLDGKSWKKWKIRHTKNLFIDTVYSEGCARGSWPVAKKSGPFASGVCATPLASLSLEYFERPSKLDKENISSFSRDYPFVDELALSHPHDLVEILKNGETPHMRSRAAFNMGDWTEMPEVVDALRKALGDRDELVRGNAVRSLVRGGIKTALSEIRKLEKDESGFVREMVTAALKQLAR